MLQRRYRNRVRLRCKFGAGSPPRQFNRVTGLILNKMQAALREEREVGRSMESEKEREKEREREEKEKRRENFIM